MADIEAPTQMPTMARLQKNEDLAFRLMEQKAEAANARKTGMNPREQKWSENWDLYWGRHDFSNKASWQSQHVMPEVPSFVDRFAAAFKGALVSTNNQFYTVDDPYDAENNLADSIKKINDVYLSTSGKNMLGTPMDFPSVFEEQVKMSAITAASAVVLWRNDVKGGRVAIETVDPRQVFLDSTNRSLYRFRDTEIDLAEFQRMTKSLSKNGIPLYNLDECGFLVGDAMSEHSRDRAESTGTSQETTSRRGVIKITECISSVTDENGKLVMDNEYALLANDRWLIRGPEKNPYWHNQDWLVFAPLINVPLSPYGRSYMEDFGSLASVYTDMTNLLLDAAYMSAMKAFVIVPEIMRNPEQLNNGFTPNMRVEIMEGYTPRDFLEAVEMGSLDAGAIQMWDKLKAELSEAAGMNDIALGQLPQKTHIASSAVQGAQQSSTTLLMSMAQSFETRFLNPVLDLSWKCGLQHSQAGDVKMIAAVGEQMWAMMHAMRKDMIKRPITFQAKGISGLIQRQQRLQSLLQVLQVIAQDPQLLQAFIQQIDMNKLIEELFHLSNVDLKKLAPTERESLIASVAQPMMQAAQGAPGAAPTSGQENMAGAMAEAIGY